MSESGIVCAAATVAVRIERKIGRSERLTSGQTATAGVPFRLALLVTKRLDRVELRRLRRGINPENGAEEGAEAKSEEDGPERRVYGRQLDEFREQQTGEIREEKAADDAHQPAQPGEGDRF